MTEKENAKALADLMARASQGHAAFMQDGLFNVFEANRIRTEISLRKSGWTHNLYIGEIHQSFLSSIESIHSPYTRVCKTEGENLGEWYVMALPIKGDFDNPVYSIRHIHPGKLSLCTQPIGKLEWVCATCEEPVPCGILWTARTKRIRSMK